MATVLNRFWSHPTASAFLISIIAIAAGFLVPPSLPVIGIMFLICGAIGYFRTSGSSSRPFWGIIAITGLIIISLIGLLLLLGLNVR